LPAPVPIKLNCRSPRYLMSCILLLYCLIVVYEDTKIFSLLL
jgi:hypothetical protein